MSPRTSSRCAARSAVRRPTETARALAESRRVSSTTIATPGRTRREHLAAGRAALPSAVKASYEHDVRKHYVRVVVVWVVTLAALYAFQRVFHR